ncbi:gamma-glutamyltransferase family protein [Ideonella sp. 4Y16]|uniref:gamma-glutamyltransferase family protein n=1 Tax=Ideonella alba TaxID=2824118 RepID=UPI001B372D26|nr:gamma-glutamyltransferase family protein [Ideonella alba]MBQ0942750.1 gamma-glutamyltransferase family protein [Ideonella alba]
MNRTFWRHGRTWLALLLSALALPACQAPPSRWEAPEIATAPQVKAGRALQRQGVAAAHPLAAEVGAQVLRDGGNALDAAIATQLVLALVEPQSSGLGGGAFLLSWDGRQLQAWDGRETAPAGATPALFLDAQGRPLPMAQAIASGRSVGVPGTLRMLEAAHRRGGHLAWARLVQPAIELAEQGIAVSLRLHQSIAASAQLRADPAARAFFFDAQGQPWPVGHRLTNPALAAVLRRVAREGADVLHRGAVANAIAQRVQRHPERPGTLNEADLAAYQPLLREPICTDWRDWRVCGMPPPSSGHIAVMQLLGLLDALPPSTDPTERAHRWIEAARLAYADRAQYLADPAFVAAPGGDWQQLLAPAYLRQRAALIQTRAMGTASPGQPGGARLAFAPQAPQPEHGTSHISVVDAQGRAVALTTTIEAGFGSGLLCDGGTGLPGGFLLNNELTDFAMQPTGADGRPVANRAEGGKRPRSSMSPTLVFDRRDGRLLATLGSPGGGAIIHFVAGTLQGLAEGLTPQQATDAPHLVNFNTPQSWLERGRWSAELLQGLRARGQQLQEDEIPSGIHVLQRDPAGHGWRGGADPRREGVVVGD